MMHFARFAGFDHEADRGAQAGADQVVMHGGGRQQGGIGIRSEPAMRSDRMMMLTPSLRRLRRARRVGRALLLPRRANPHQR